MPSAVPLENDLVRLEPFTLDSIGALAVVAAGAPPAVFHHLFFGPFASPEEFRAWAAPLVDAVDRRVFAVIDRRRGRPVGSCSLINIDRANGAAEIGSVWYTPDAQGTYVNTGAVLLLLASLFEGLSYRRVVWKCDSTNDVSREAALRLGFRFEGVARNHMIVKGRSRDTAWYAMIDREWPEAKSALEKRLRRKVAATQA